jgi:demethylmenaquinone methyltransferase / 2-methoxy-6-polyprenyl-1,4-benzoquinol methylase
VPRKADVSSVSSVSSVVKPSAHNPAWNDELLKDPHAVADKRRRVREMFAAIAPSYDFNNRLHSFGRDQAWRRRAVKLSELRPDDVVVDVACGTGDLTLAYWDALAHLSGWRLKSPPPATRSSDAPTVIGIDFTFPMLPIARRKAGSGPMGPDFPDDRHGKRLQDVTFLNADAMALPLPDACTDVVSIAFGIRNVQDPAVALKEFYRVLKPGGRLIILEFSQPRNRLIRWCNDLYCSKIMPHTATWLSGDKSGAYKYLPMSVKTFIDRDTMSGMIRDAGFSDVTQHPLTFGVCVVYRGRKVEK